MKPFYRIFAATWLLLLIAPVHSAPNANQPHWSAANQQPTTQSHPNAPSEHSMKYQHILSALMGEVWAIEPSKGSLIAAFIADQVSGVKYSAAEITARIAPDAADLAANQARAGARIGNVRLKGGGGVAVVSMHGIISPRGGMTNVSEPLASVADFVGGIQAAMADDQFTHVLLDFDSPGGAISGVPEAFQAIKAMRGTKPMVGHVNFSANSAAYWLASAADEISITPSGSAGNIGVYTMHESIGKALAEKGVEREYISAGKHKLEGNPLAPLTDEARAHIQAQVDDAYQMFTADVAAGRGIDAATVRTGYGEGRALHARAALAAGLVDRIETAPQLLQRLGESASNNPAPRSRYHGMSATDWDRRHRYA